jgi:chitodextrinase
MSVARTALAALVLAVTLIAVSAAPAKKPPPLPPPPPPPPPADSTAPTAPTNLHITASSDTSISLAWNASTDSGTWWYCVQKDGFGCFRVDPPNTTFTMTKLMPDRTTTWTVYAVDSAGNRSASSNPVTHTTPPDTTPPSPPPTLSLTSAYPTRISVAWTRSVDNITQTWYTLLVDGSPFVETVTPNGSTVFHLTPSSTHTFEVTARDGYGNTVESNMLTVTTPAKTDNVAPSPPTNLQFSFQTDPPELWLNWQQSTDDTDPQSQILYDVYLNGVFSEDGAVGYGSTITYCREPGPTEVTLTAVDTSGNESAPSNSLHIDC